MKIEPKQIFEFDSPRRLSDEEKRLYIDLFKESPTSVPHQMVRESQDTLRVIIYVV